MLAAYEVIKNKGRMFHLSESKVGDDAEGNQISDAWVVFSC